MSLVPERDRLYALLLESLEEPSKAEDFHRLAAEAPPGSYTARKAARYLEALSGWKPSGKPRADALSLAERLFNAGLYFDTHEYLETAWRQAQEPWKDCLQGLIQLAAGFHKLELDPEGRAGALYLLERGLQKLRAHTELFGPGVAAGIESGLQPALKAVSAGRTPQPPRLRWT